MDTKTELQAAIDRLVDLTLTQIDTPVKYGQCRYCESGSEPTKVRHVTPAVDVPGWDGTRHEHRGVPCSADDVYDNLRPEDEWGWDDTFAREVADALVALRDATE